MKIEKVGEVPCVFGVGAVYKYVNQWKYIYDE